MLYTFAFEWQLHLCLCLSFKSLSILSAEFNPIKLVFAYRYCKKCTCVSVIVPRFPPPVSCSAIIFNGWSLGIIYLFSALVFADVGSLSSVAIALNCLLPRSLVCFDCLIGILVFMDFDGYLPPLCLFVPLCRRVY